LSAPKQRSGKPIVFTTIASQLSGANRQKVKYYRTKTNHNTRKKTAKSWHKSKNQSSGFSIGYATFMLH